MWPTNISSKKKSGHSSHYGTGQSSRSAKSKRKGTSNQIGDANDSGWGEWSEWKWREDRQKVYRRRKHADGRVETVYGRVELTEGGADDENEVEEDGEYDDVLLQDLVSQDESEWERSTEMNTYQRKLKNDDLNGFNVTDNSRRTTGLAIRETLTNGQDQYTSSSQLEENNVEGSLVDVQHDRSVTRITDPAAPLRNAAGTQTHHLPATVLNAVGSVGITALDEDQYRLAVIGGSAAIILGVANTAVAVSNSVSARKSAKAAELSAKVAADKLAFEKEEAAAKKIAEAKANSISQGSEQGSRGSSYPRAPVQSANGCTVDAGTNRSTPNSSKMNAPLPRHVFPIPKATTAVRAMQASPNKEIAHRQLMNVEAMLKKFREKKAKSSGAASQIAFQPRVPAETGLQKQNEAELNLKLAELRRNLLAGNEPGSEVGESSRNRDSNKNDQWQPNNASSILLPDDEHSEDSELGLDIGMPRLSLRGKRSTGTESNDKNQTLERTEDRESNKRNELNKASSILQSDSENSGDEALGCDIKMDQLLLRREGSKETERNDENQDMNGHDKGGQDQR